MKIAVIKKDFQAIDNLLQRRAPHSCKNDPAGWGCHCILYCSSKVCGRLQVCGEAVCLFHKKGEISVSNCQSTVQDAPEINTGFFQERPK
jgi:hypothetical protein